MDYPSLHVRVFANQGYSFVSASRESVETGSVDLKAYPIVDFIMGKQRQYRMGRGHGDIKFKVWDKSKSVMNNYPQQMNMNENGLIVMDRFVWLQYTGLKGKNSVEIYEGDIMKLEESKEKYELRYLGNRFVLCKYDNIVFEDEAYFSEREVVGNIYENPELLKGEI